MSTDIVLKPWLRVVTPHADVRAGTVDESVYAADLSDVVADRGPLEYRDPALFFRRTYPTHGLVSLVRAVLGRLAGQPHGDGVIQIQTPFGGGKTHSLIALYHLVKHAATLQGTGAASALLEQAGVELPAATVVTFVGTAADALQGRTPWGELAHQLGRGDLLAEHDRRRRAPGKDRLHALLGDQPTLILMDEVAEYAVKAKDFRDQVVAFLQELSEVVKVLPRCALVVTLPSSVPYGEEGERALRELQHVLGRLEHVHTPVEGEEIYEVVRRRLFEDLGNPAEARRTVEAFFDLYARLRDDVPREAREPAYRERMLKAYPFHPELIDGLFERWGTFAQFQRTRGVLRLLALVVAQRYRRNDGEPLILPAHIDLSRAEIRQEFIKHIGVTFEGVIASDIAGDSAKAAQIDRELGSEYARFAVASGLATAIFFGSFSGSTDRRGVNPQRLRLMTVQPDLPIATIGDTLGRLEETLWYLHKERGNYEFRAQPNFNRILVEREEGVREDAIREAIREQLSRLAGNQLRVVLWPDSPSDVPDVRELRLVVLSLEHTARPNQPPELAREILQRSGNAFRTYQNAVVVLAADDAAAATLRSQTRTWLALKAISADQALVEQLAPQDRERLHGRLAEAEQKVVFSVLAAYRHLAKAENGGARWFDLGLPTVGEQRPLAGRVQALLRDQEVLLERIAPSVLLRKALAPEERERPVRDVIEAFWRYPSLPMLSSEMVAQEAIAQGVRDGVFAVRVGGRAYCREALPEAVWRSDDAVLLRDPLPPTPPAPDQERQPTEPQPEGHRLAEPSPGADLGAPPDAASGGAPPGYREVRLRVRLPWDKFSDFVRGVVRPLHEGQAELDIEIAIHARARAGAIPAETLDRTVKETLEQIKAQVLQEEKR